jgi:hypothetical protein
MIFGAKLVFKVLANFAFKNNSQNKVFDLQMGFKWLFQNLIEISKCTLKQSCREYFSELLCFWAQFVKMLFACSK